MKPELWFLSLSVVLMPVSVWMQKERVPVHLWNYSSYHGHESHSKKFYLKNKVTVFVSSVFLVW